MRGQKVLAKRFEFYFADLDNSILVERTDYGTIVIHALRDNVSEERKAHFIRQLAAEGFIPDQFQWFNGAITDSCGLYWVVDHSWMMIHPEVKRRTAKIMRWLLLSGLLLWIVLMSCVIVPHLHLRFEDIQSSAHPSQSSSSQPQTGEH
jgi:hypothetical protein